MGVRTLRTIFLLLGGIGGAIILLGAIVRPPTGLRVVLLSSLIGCACYLYLGLRLERLLAATPSRARLLLSVVGGQVGLNLLVNAVLQSVPGLVGGMIGLALVWFFINRVHRLSSEASHQVASGRPTPG